MAIVVLTKVHQLLFDSLFDGTILHLTFSIYSLSFSAADDTMPLFRTCSTSRHIYLARFVQSILFLSAQQILLYCLHNILLINQTFRGL